jgi:hypothetical protein
MDMLLLKVRRWHPHRIARELGLTRAEVATILEIKL